MEKHFRKPGILILVLTFTDCEIWGKNTLSPSFLLLRDLDHSPHRITLEESESISKGSESVLYYLTATPLQSNTQRSLRTALF